MLAICSKSRPDRSFDESMKRLRTHLETKSAALLCLGESTDERAIAVLKDFDQGDRIGDEVDSKSLRFSRRTEGDG